MTKLTPRFLLVSCISIFLATHVFAGSWSDEGKAFLEANAKKRGVITTESGLQYKIIRPGDGPKPRKYSRVQVYYTGRLQDGTKFDSSPIYEPPVTLSVHRVIRGWSEALQLMPVGSKWELFIPSELAYGSRGQGKNIPPDSILIFDLHLVGIQ